MQTSTRPTTSRLRPAATVVVFGLVGALGSVGLGTNAASADDSFAIVAPPTPIVFTQNDPAAVAEKAIPATEVKLDVVRAKATGAIAKRQASLAVGQAKLAKESADTPDCGFDAARGVEMNATSAGLATHGIQLAGASDLAVANTLYREIFTKFRVYLVVLPKTGLAIRCDNALASIAAFNTSAVKVQASIEAAKLKGVSVVDAQALKTTAFTAVAGLNPVGAITPCMSLVPDLGDSAVQGSNAKILGDCDASLDTIRASLKTARAQLKDARDLLKDAGHDAKKDAQEADRVARKAKNDAEKAAREVARDAKKTAHEAKKAAEKALRDARKAARKN